LVKATRDIALVVLIAIFGFNGIALIVNPKWWLEARWTLSLDQCRVWLQNGMGLWQFRVFGVVLCLGAGLLLIFFISSL
jgi:hypothetical protein